MRSIKQSIIEEIIIYQKENSRLQMEDMLRAIGSKKQIYQEQISENEARIERLLGAMKEGLKEQIGLGQPDKINNANTVK